MSLRKVLLAATIIALPVTAQAQWLDSLYVGAGAGVGMMFEADVDLSSAFPAPRSGTAEFKAGAVGLLSLGYNFGNGWRAELEGAYRQNSVDAVNGLGAPAGDIRASGNTRSLSLMLNALYDLDLGLPVVPYVGAGVGVAYSNWNNVRQASIANPGDFTHLVGSTLGLGYQAILGASLPLTEWVPGLSMTTEYRFFGILDSDRDAFRYFANGSPRIAGSFDTQYMHHSVVLGLRYAFGAAPAPAPVVAPAPAAAPAPARTYLVFFDFDRAELTDRARQIIAEAAQNAQRASTTRIEVAGHADRAGTPQYNQRLSERRAQAVAAELERRGVARSAMTIQAFGETRPLVPTADGVREPQNRRVEIVLR